jgi:hypothetical protein
VSVIAEEVFHAALMSGFQMLRDDPRYVYQLFRHLRRESQTQISDFVQHGQFDVRIGYQRSPPVLPGIVIVLRASNELTGVLGDFQGYDSLPEDLQYDGGIPPEVLGGTASASGFAGQGELLDGPRRVDAAGANYFESDEAPWFPQQFEDTPSRVHVIGGLGAGQILDVLTNTEGRVTLRRPWLTIPDEDSIVEIRAAEVSEDVIGEPAAIYDRRSDELMESRGTIDRGRYEIQVFDANEWLTIYLAHLVKALLFSTRVVLEGAGVRNLKIGMTDLAQRPEYVPDHAFMRTLICDFDAEFSVAFPVESFATELRMKIFAAGDATPVADTTFEIGPEKPAVE